MKYFDLAILSANLQQKTLSLGYSQAIVASKLVLQTQVDIRKASAAKGIALLSSANNEVLKKASNHQGNYPLLIDAYSVPNFYRDDGLIRAVAHQSLEGRKVAFAIPYAYLLRSSFVFRARFVAQTKLFIAKCIKRNAPFVLVSGAENAFELKSPREAIALAQLFDISFEQAQKALSSTPQKLLGETSK